MAVLYTNHFVQFFDDNGDPLSGGKLYAYSAGTTTPKATYTTEEATVENANPVVLDSAGRATIFIQGSYRFDLFDANDVLIKSTDDVTSFTALDESGSPFFQSFSGDGSTTVFALSETLGTDSKNIMVFVDSSRPTYVTNGTFATDTGWTKGAGWTIGSGVATATGAISTAIEQTAAETLAENQSYVLTYTVTRSAGGIIPSIGGNNGTERTASGTYREIIVAGSTQDIKFTGNAFTGTIDNVVIKSTADTGYDIQNPSSYSISGTSLTFTIAPDTGSDNIYVFAPTKLLGAASASAAAAAASEAAAAASAVEAAASAGLLEITSTTSLAIGTGSKAFTVASGLSLEAGQWVIISSDANPTVNYMTGNITSYSGTTLTINVVDDFGSGTLADWTIKLSGVQGAQGPAGTIGTLLSDNNTFTGDNIFQGVVDVTNVNAEGSGGGNLRTNGGTNCISWGSGGSANSTLGGNMSGASTYKLTNMIDPTAAQDYATKAYVDAQVLASHISGLLLSSIAGNSTTASLTVSAGQATDSTNAQLINSASPLSWAVSNGNAANGYQGGTTLPNSDTIHVFVISGSSGVASFAHNGLTPTLPSGYTYYRRVGSFNTNGSGAPLPYTMIEGAGGSAICYLSTAVQDYNSTVGTTATLITTSAPSDIKVQPFMKFTAGTNPSYTLVSSPDEPDAAPSTLTAPGADIWNEGTSVAVHPFLTTDTSARIRARSTTTANIKAHTKGWLDFRR